MKVEIDTDNKTIKIVGESSLEELLEFILGLGKNTDYKIIPNTIINTIKIRDIYDPWVKPYTQPWTPSPQPYTRPTIWYGTGNANITISDTINTNNLRNSLCEEK